jgi:hypothetical protein
LPLVRYRLLFWMTVAGACDRAEQEIAGMKNRMSGAEHVIIDRVADVQLKDDDGRRNGRVCHAPRLLPTPCPPPSR